MSTESYLASGPECFSIVTGDMSQGHLILMLFSKERNDFFLGSFVEALSFIAAERTFGSSVLRVQHLAATRDSEQNLVATSKTFEDQVGQEVDPIHRDGLLKLVRPGKVLFEEFLFDFVGEGRVGARDVLLMIDAQAEMIQVA